jgi:uncharacterized protein
MHNTSMEDLRLLIDVQNPHWEKDFLYPYSIKRKILTDLGMQLKNNLILSLSGPRRTGKTIALKQLINELILQGFPRENILYFSFDEASYTPLQIIKAWEGLISKKVSGKNFFIFFDEVQNIEDWAHKLKLIYDNLGLKIILSGSAGLRVRKGSESLAGRTVERHLSALDFEEFLLFSGIGRPTSSNIDSMYMRFLSRQLPELALNESLRPEEYIKNLVKKVIYEDSRHYYNIEYVDVLDGIFKSISSLPGQIINISDISKDFGINRATASSYMSALEGGFLARKLYNYSKNARKTEKRSKKYYPYYTSLIRYPGRADMGHIAETEAASVLGAEFFYNEKGHEIDFILGPDHDVGLEVKYRKRVDNKDIRTLLTNPIDLKRKAVLVPFECNSELSGVEVLRLSDLSKFSENLIS